MRVTDITDEDFERLNREILTDLKQETEYSTQLRGLLIDQPNSRIAKLWEQLCSKKDNRLVLVLKREEMVGNKLRDKIELLTKQLGEERLANEELKTRNSHLLRRMEEMQERIDDFEVLLKLQTRNKHGIKHHEVKEEETKEEKDDNKSITAGLYKAKFQVVQVRAARLEEKNEKLQQRLRSNLTIYNKLKDEVTALRDGLQFVKHNVKSTFSDFQQLTTMVRKRTKGVTGAGHLDNDLAKPSATDYLTISKLVLSIKSRIRKMILNNPTASIAPWEIESLMEEDTKKTEDIGINKFRQDIRTLRNIEKVMQKYLSQSDTNKNASAITMMEEQQKNIAERMLTLGATLAKRGASEEIKTTPELEYTFSPSHTAASSVSSTRRASYVPPYPVAGRQHSSSYGTNSKPAGDLHSHPGERASRIEQDNRKHSQDPYLSSTLVEDLLPAVNEIILNGEEVVPDTTEQAADGEQVSPPPCEQKVIIQSQIPLAASSLTVEPYRRLSSAHDENTDGRRSPAVMKGQRIPSASHRNTGNTLDVHSTTPNAANVGHPKGSGARGGSRPPTPPSPPLSVDMPTYRRSRPGSTTPYAADGSEGEGSKSTSLPVQPVEPLPLSQPSESLTHEALPLQSLSQPPTQRTQSPSRDLSDSTVRTAITSEESETSGNKTNHHDEVRAGAKKVTPVHERSAVHVSGQRGNGKEISKVQGTLAHGTGKTRDTRSKSESQAPHWGTAQARRSSNRPSEGHGRASQSHEISSNASPGMNLNEGRSKSEDNEDVGVDDADADTPSQYSAGSEAPATMSPPFREGPSPRPPAAPRPSIPAPQAEDRRVSQQKMSPLNQESNDHPVSRQFFSSVIEEAARNLGVNALSPAEREELETLISEAKKLIKASVRHTLDRVLTSIRVKLALKRMMKHKEEEPQAASEKQENSEWIFCWKCAHGPFRKEQVCDNCHAQLMYPVVENREGNISLVALHHLQLLKHASDTTWQKKRRKLLEERQSLLERAFNMLKNKAAEMKLDVPKDLLEISPSPSTVTNHPTSPNVPPRAVSISIPLKEKRPVTLIPESQSLKLPQITFPNVLRPVSSQHTDDKVMGDGLLLIHQATIQRRISRMPTEGDEFPVKSPQSARASLSPADAFIDTPTSPYVAAALRSPSYVSTGEAASELPTIKQLNHVVWPSKSEALSPPTVDTPRKVKQLQIQTVHRVSISPLEHTGIVQNSNGKFVSRPSVVRSHSTH